MNPLFKPAPTDVFAGGVAQLPSPWAHRTHRPVFIAFLVCFVVAWVTLLLDVSFPEEGISLEGLFWLLTAATSLLGLARRLPEQNLFMAAVLIATLSFTLALVGEKTRVPFGPRSYTAALGDKIFGVPWPMPLLWMVIIINSRGVARLIMRPWRKTTYYGLWVIGLACLLAVSFDAGLEPFATRVRHYWFWETHLNIPSWYSAPWVNFLGWFVATLGILAFTTPWLINKQPVKQPTDYHPLALWLLLNIYFATGNALQQFWVAVAFSLSVNVLVTAYAVRGARW
jgi:uncharacterized membrane protein